VYPTIYQCRAFAAAGGLLSWRKFDGAISVGRYLHRPCPQGWEARRVANPTI